MRLRNMRDDVGNLWSSNTTGGRTGLAIEDRQPTHIDGAIACLRKRLPGAAGNPGGVAPLAGAKRPAAITPLPRPTKVRREAIGIVVLIVMGISVYGTVCSPTGPRIRTPRQEDPA